MNKLLTFLAILVSLLSARPAAAYEVGVYYFPGWRSGLKAAPSLRPWDRIKAFKEREPLLGWYDDGSTDVVNQQLGWMHDYGLSFVVFDWYWGNGQVQLEQSLRAYFSSPNRSKVPFALLWANHDDAPTSQEDFSAMVRYWIDNYFKRPEIYKVDGRPVVFIFDHPMLSKRAQSFGMNVGQLIRIAQDLVKQANLPPIFFVGSTFSKDRAAGFGYDATSTYNYPGLERPSHNYRELISDYRRVWQFQAGRNDVPYIVPMTQGWDRRPWGGSREPEHDLSGGDVSNFETHLRAARDFMDQNPTQTRKMGVICCWNEFGEGSYIEPTRQGGFGFLEKVRDVFGAPTK